jgi:hypothetical protein
LCSEQSRQNSSGVSSCQSMEVVAETPSKRKKARKRVHAVSHFFFEKVKTLLCRTRNAIKVFPDAANVPLNVLDDLDAFADLRSLDDVCGLLGGPKSLLSKLFLSIIDDDEKAELEVYACLPRSKKDVFMIEQQIHSLVNRAQALADHVQTSSDPLIVGVLTLKVEQAPSNDNEPDTGTGASVEIESTKSKRGRSAKKLTVYEDKAEKKKNESGKTPTKRPKQSKLSATSGLRNNNESGSGGRQNKAISDKPVSGKQAKAAASSSNGKQAKAAASEAEAELQLDDVHIKPTALSEEDIVQMLKDAEKEFESIRLLRLFFRRKAHPSANEPNGERVRNVALADVLKAVTRLTPLPSDNKRTPDDESSHM